jgi:multiple sugar transport system substrate-binding protein
MINQFQKEKTMKRKFWLLVVSLLVVASMVLAGCGTAPAAEEDTVLRVWIVWGDNPEQIQSLFDQYGAEHGVTVEVTAPVDLERILPGLTGSDGPDVLVLSGGDLVKSYASEDLVLPLNEYVDSGLFDLADISEASIGQCMDGETILCLPWGADVYALFWNKDMFEAAGLDPEVPPATMEELAQFAEQLTIVNADGSLEQVGFIPDFSWSHLDLYVRMFGGFWYNDDGTEVTIDSQPMLDALAWEQQFYSNYGADNVMAFSSVLGGYTSPDQGFYAGRVAMMVDGEWQVGPNFIQNYKPDLNYGVTAFPPSEAHPELAGTVVVQGTAAIIPANAPNPDAAADLLAWMLSPEIVAEEMYANYNIPTSLTAAQDARFQSDPNFMVFIDLANGANATPIITTPISLELNDELGRIEEEVLHTGAEAQPLLTAAQEQYSQLLAEALAR